MQLFEDAVHFLEPMGRESKDMHVFGDGLKTLLRRSDTLRSFIVLSLQGTGSYERSESRSF